jgi:hypothetical protein
LAAAGRHRHHHANHLTLARLEHQPAREEAQERGERRLARRRVSTQVDASTPAVSETG